MKKLNKWLDTPWTWRTYLRLCLVCTLAYVPVMWYYLSEYGIIPSPKDVWQYVKEKFVGETD